MSTEKMTPTPTDYAGVRFRSKSEAVFARSLDLAGANRASGLMWSYEQDTTKLLGEGTTSDFTLVFKLEHGGDLLLWQIEYKPSKPSAAYVENWVKRIRANGRLVGLHAIAYGSPWNHEYGMVGIGEGFTGLEEESGAWPLGAQSYAAQARSYRFDLANPGSNQHLGPVTAMSGGKI